MKTVEQDKSDPANKSEKAVRGGC